MTPPPPPVSPFGDARRSAARTATFALLLLGAPHPSALAQDAVDAPSTADASPPEAPSAPAGFRLQALGTGLFAQQVVTADDKRQSYYGVGLEYVAFRGPGWGFYCDLSMSFPMRVRQSGASPGLPDSGNVRRNYDRNLGFDMVFGAGKHFGLPHDLDLVVGGGVHYNSIDLNDADYVRINGMTLGVAGMATLSLPVWEVLAVAAHAKVATDFVDLIHDTGKLRFGLVWSLSVSVALTLGRTS